MGHPGRAPRPFGPAGDGGGGQVGAGEEAQVWEEQRGQPRYTRTEGAGDAGHVETAHVEGEVG